MPCPLGDVNPHEHRPGKTLGAPPCWQEATWRQHNDTSGTWATRAPLAQTHGGHMGSCALQDTGMGQPTVPGLGVT